MKNVFSRPTAYCLLVRKGGLEPPHLSVPDPKSGASANSATFASQPVTRNKNTGVGEESEVEEDLSLESQTKTSSMCHFSISHFSFENETAKSPRTAEFAKANKTSLGLCSWNLVLCA
jgi:hypothetical protein